MQNIIQCPLMKHRLKKISVFFLIILTCSFYVKGQDPHFSQYNRIPLYLNPALAGMGKDFNPRVILNFRDQWPSIPSNYLTYAASFDMYFSKAKSAIGVLFLADRAGKGTFNTYTVSAVYAFNVSLTRNLNLRLAIRPGYYYQFLDWQKLQFIDMFDSQLGAVYNSAVHPPEQLAKHNFDLGAGALFFTKKWYFGMAVDHLSPVDLGYLGQNYKLPMKYTIHGGGLFNLRTQKEYSESLWDIKMAPYAICQCQKGYYQFNYGSNFWINPLICGISLRHTGRDFDAVILSAGISFNQFTVLYSYDFTTSKLFPQSGGSHEISLQYNINYNDCDHCQNLRQRHYNTKRKHPPRFSSPIYL